MIDLPQPIVDDLFDMAHNSYDMSVCHLHDHIHSIGFTVTECVREGVLIRLYFKSGCHTGEFFGVLTINRLERSFSVEASGSCGFFLPVNGSWADICKYLIDLMRILRADDGTYRQGTLE